MSLCICVHVSVITFKYFQWMEVNRRMYVNMKDFLSIPNQSRNVNRHSNLQQRERERERGGGRNVSRLGVFILQVYVPHLAVSCWEDRSQSFSVLFQLLELGLQLCMGSRRREQIPHYLLLEGLTQLPGVAQKREKKIIVCVCLCAGTDLWLAQSKWYCLSNAA